MSILLTALGLYSVMAYAVARQTRETGIRFALGGKPIVVAGQILGKALAVGGGGVAAGICISEFLVSFVANEVKGISVHNADTFALSATLLVAVTFLAAAIPVQRVVRIECQQALHSE